MSDLSAARQSVKNLLNGGGYFGWVAVDLAVPLRGWRLHQVAAVALLVFSQCSVQAAELPAPHQITQTIKLAAGDQVTEGLLAGLKTMNAIADVSTHIGKAGGATLPAVNEDAAKNPKDETTEKGGGGMKEKGDGGLKDWHVSLLSFFAGFLLSIVTAPGALKLIFALRHEVFPAMRYFREKFAGWRQKRKAKR